MTAEPLAVLLGQVGPPAQLSVPSSFSQELGRDLMVPVGGM